MRLAGLVSLLDDLPDFRRLVDAVTAPAPAPDPADEPALPSPVATATVREAGKPFLLAETQRVQHFVITSACARRALLRQTRSNLRPQTNTTRPLRMVTANVMSCAHAAASAPSRKRSNVR